MAKRKYFDRHQADEGTGSNVDIKDSKVPPGEEYHYTNIIVRNETSNDSYATIGVEKADTFHPASEVLPLVAGLDSQYSGNEIVVLPEELLVVRFEGNTSGDDLQVRFRGYSWQSGKAE
jgi:hypothetical protein